MHCFPRCPWLSSPPHTAQHVREQPRIVLNSSSENKLKKKKAIPPSQTLLKSAMSHVCPWLYSFQGSVFLCPWKCTLNINTAFSVTFDQFNDYTIFKDTFCCYVVNPGCSYSPFPDRIVAKTDYSLFESEIISGYMTAWNFPFNKWQTFSSFACYQSTCITLFNTVLSYLFF